MTRALLVVLAAFLVASPAASAATCTDRSGGTRSFSAGSSRGHLAYPSRPHRAIVVIAHGYSFTAKAWRSKVADVAERDRAVVVAVDYRDNGARTRDPRGFERERGWAVRRAALDVLTVTRALQRRCSGTDRAVLLGFSMGAQVSSLAVARAPRTFDAFLGVEGIYDWTSTWRVGQGFRESNAFARQAFEDMEKEAGGTPDAAPAAWAARNPVELAPRVARGTKRIVLVHARDDGLALFSFAEEMAKRLRAAGRAPRFVEVGPRGPDDEPDTSLAESLGQPRAGAGHAPDYATRHVTVRTALRELAKLVRAR